MQKGTERPLNPESGIVLFSADETRMLEWFHWHKPNAAQQKRIEELRWHYRAVAAVVLMNLPAGPDRTVAIRLLHESQMTALKAIVLEAPAEPIETPANVIATPGGLT